MHVKLHFSSFGSTREEAVANLKEAVELFFEGESGAGYTPGQRHCVRPGDGECLNGTGRIAIVPHPKKELPIGTTRSIIRQSGLTPAGVRFLIRLPHVVTTRLGQK